ncbi:hypothetical protein BJV78DRAFT_1279449 [Lactifluus subvellereus]|nr:hypothetical protein BJV78DRAFT_1279449 [Lactifluus subvellereus]
MDDRVYPYTCTSDGSVYLGFPPPENRSGHPPTETSATLASDRTFPHHEEQMSSWQPHLHAYTHNPPASAEVYPTGFHPSMQSTVIPGTLTPHPRNFPFHPENFPSDCPSDSLCKTTFPWFHLPTPVPHAPLKDPSHQYDLSGATLLHSGPNRAAPTASIPRLTLCYNRSWELGGEPTTASSTEHPASSSQLAGTCAAHERRYSCKDCGKEYTQPQGLSRHRREMHERRPCIYCLDFKWGRRYMLRKHIKEQHPELNTDAALNEATGTRRGAAIASNPTGFNCR